MSEKEKVYTKDEEVWNVASHVAGIIGGLVVGVLFIAEVIKHNGDGLALTSVVLYIVGMMLSHVCSSVYHASQPGTAFRRCMRKFDHAAIYWHIAGSYSPITLIAMRDSGWWGYGIFVFIWLCALLGTSLSFFKQKKQNRLETVCYVLMGLTIVVAMKQFYDAVPLSAFLWVIGEGVAYIIGAVLYSCHKVKFIHTVFHFFVLLGSLCHIIAVWKVLTTML